MSKSEFVWSTNESVNKKVAVCLLCKSRGLEKEIKMADSDTSGLKKHLLKEHPTEYEVTYLQSKSTQQTDEISFSQEEFHKKLVEWLAKKYLPFNFFDDAFTHNIFKSLNQDTVL
ncbi:uncharacterized protein LOC117175112 isoform X2 [Belonocnema kinseyi]|uniref:uncharacterized protein LOC117175112 isoform X2 n=1 Tax=Belonocnema kinseyi TaxID=2817044 RepID=UPI00143DEA5A|nr:uncharacterized protein LOC117175112 isoform X2 [Belonocnema kinseyi]